MIDYVTYAVDISCKRYATLNMKIKSVDAGYMIVIDISMRFALFH